MVFFGWVLAASADAFHVQVEVDFGPIGKPTLRKSVEVKEGNTALDATKMAVPLKQAFVCCDPEDVETIDGVKCDPEREGWWLYEVNGAKAPVSAHRFRLAEGDRVRWYYVIQGSIKEASITVYKVAKVKRGGKIEGQVSLSGAVPVLPPYGVHKNHEACGEKEKLHACAGSVGPQGVKGAVAWLEGVASGKPWPVKKGARVLDQRACEFIPHRLIVPLDAQVEVRNNDPVLHTVHGYGKNFKTVFQITQKGRASRHAMTMDQPGAFDVQCDAGHRWMKAHVLVMANPYYVVANDQGRFVIDSVPPGRYTLNVWHDCYKTVSREVTVEAGGTAHEIVAYLPDQFRIDLRYAQ